MLGTMFDGRTLHSREVMDRLVQAWGDKVFHTVIRRTVKFSDSTVAGEPITSYASTSAGAEPYRDSRRRCSRGATTREPSDCATTCSAHRRGRAARVGAPVRNRPELAEDRRGGRPAETGAREEPSVRVPRREDDRLHHLRRACSSRARPAGPAPRQGLAVDRGRLVREALALVLADYEANGDDSALVRRLTEE